MKVLLQGRIVRLRNRLARRGQLLSSVYLKFRYKISQLLEVVFRGSAFRQGLGEYVSAHHRGGPDGTHTALPGFEYHF